jgi:glutamate carboxypeptidase
LIWLILGALQQFCPEVYHSTRWMVALNASEEVLSGDFALRAGERCPEGAKAVLVFEGGPRVGDNEFHLVTSRKGRAEYRLAARGRAAHAGSSHAEGVNAIVGLAATIQSAAALTDYEAGLTVNVATVTGGTVLNRVPHEAAAELEIRAFDPETLARAQAALEGLAGRPAGHAAQVEVTCLGLTPAWPHDSRVEKLFQTWADAAAPLGYTLKNVARGGLSDANYLCHLGPTLDGLGPAGGNAHCSELSPEEGKWPEYVEPSSFVPKAAMAVLGIGRLCREISHNF